MLLRLAFLTVTNLFAALRLLPMSDGDKDAEILALRHQLAVFRTAQPPSLPAVPASPARQACIRPSAHIS
ncbi:hypothetical protein [Streptomyces sp. NPDC058695]|uniref:hypothetical protein n=1 Tax=Streptomyces sp. NPDC058695 TaxID=3346604 RepID=UPI0036546C2B